MQVTPDPEHGFRALTVKQPWASQILSGAKVWEYREWTHEYCGDVLITSSARADTSEGPVDPTLPLGVTICVARIGRILGDPGMDDVFEWELLDVRPVRQLPIKGATKLWKVSDATMRALGLTLGAPSTETRYYDEE